MRFVDDKGRVFGLINLIDLSVVVLLFLLIASIAVNYFTRPVTKTSNRGNVDVEMKVLYPGVLTEILKDRKVLNPGDVVLGGNAVIAKVLEVRPVLDNEGRETIHSNIVVLIKAKCVKLNGEYYCANIPIKINAYVHLSQPLYIFENGKILDMVVHDEKK